MKKLPLRRSKHWLTGAAAGLATWSGGSPLIAAPWVDAAGSVRRAATLDQYTGGYEHILGTSLDLVIEAARPSDAAACEAEILREIERLRRILSTYDPASEIRRAMAGGEITSVELSDLLAAYDTWSVRTGGLVDANLGGVIAAWREAATTGRMPDRSALAVAARRDRAYNVDALGKGFIIDRAVAAGRRFAPGGILNLGGDIRAWGDSAWTVSIADPRQPADNAPPMAHFTLREAAVATSGGYARNFQVGGKRFSHLIDPRTQWPLAVAGSATVVAADCVTANALSTAASIVGPVLGGELAQREGATGWLLTDGSSQLASGGLLAAAPMAVPLSDTAQPAASSPAPAPAPAPSASGAEKSAPSTPAPAAPAAAAPLPAGFQVSMQVILKEIENKREYYRPYTAIWIENEHGLLVRTIAIWGPEPRWQGKLTTWNYQTRGNRTRATQNARSTRAAGTYTVIWDGKDDVQRRLPQGNYKLTLEIAREHGYHVLEEVPLTLGETPFVTKFNETAESAQSSITYGPAAQP